MSSQPALRTVEETVLVDVLDFLVRMLNRDDGRWDDELETGDWLAEWLSPDGSAET